MDEAKRKQIISILDDVNDMTVATVRPDGYPQATIVSYVNDGMTIYFNTGAASQKADNIKTNNKVSLTVNRPYQSWEDIEGVSISGAATQITDADDIARIGKMLLGKFPEALKYADVDLGELALFRVDPHYVSLLDYSQGFGHAETMQV